MTSAESPPSPTRFIVTKEYRRFAEFCDGCREARALHRALLWVAGRRQDRFGASVCTVGPTGVPDGWSPTLPPSCNATADSGPWRTVLFTPGVTNTPRTVEQAVGNLWGMVDRLSTRATWYHDPDAAVLRQPPDLLVVDKADRLKTASLEQLRDFYDRRPIGVVLIGMPGLQKRLARYAQLYSRVGFVHQFRPLSGLELQGVIAHQWVQLGLDAALYEHVDAAVVNAIARNRRQLSSGPASVCTVERILAINNLPTVTTDVVSLARERLVDGPL